MDIFQKAKLKAKEVESMPELPNMDVASFVDYTLLKPEATYEDVRKLCRIAMSRKYYAVCVNPIHVSLAKEELEGTNVKVCSVLSFPLGADSLEAKLKQAEVLRTMGVDEIDMVMNISAFKSGDYDRVRKEIESVLEIFPNLKVIVETALLTDEEKLTACKLVKDAGAKFVKTSTGFSKGGATLYDVALLRLCVGESLGVKASGGIRTYEKAVRMILAGANRIGTSTDILA